MQFFKKNKEKQKVNIEPVMEQEIIIEEIKVTEEVIPSYEEILRVFFTTHQSFINGTKQIIRDYYIIKLFSYIALDTNGLKEKLHLLDTFYFEFMKDVEQLKEQIDSIKNDGDLKIQYLKTKQFILLLQNKKMQLTDYIFNIRLDHYENIKVATLGIVHNKSSEDIKKYYDDIAAIIKTYKNIQEAAEHTYFNSADDLNQAIDIFSKLTTQSNKTDSKNQTSIEYFRKYNYVLTLSMREWVELINNMKFALKTVGKIDAMKYDRAKRKYEILEKKCFILMLYFELVANDKSLKNFEMV